jgi:octaprenyl-diphosphate synthase
LGIAFQIVDDLLDVQGDEQTTGKSLGTDLEKQKPTLPVIRALHLASDRDRQSLIDLLTGDERRSDLLEPFLDRYEAIAYARARAQFFADRAQQRLSILPSGPARDVLAAMSRFVVSRSA